MRSCISRRVSWVEWVVGCSVADCQGRLKRTHRPSQRANAINTSTYHHCYHHHHQTSSLTFQLASQPSYLPSYLLSATCSGVGGRVVGGRGQGYDSIHVAHTLARPPACPLACPPAHLFSKLTHGQADRDLAALRAAVKRLDKKGPRDSDVEGAREAGELLAPRYMMGGIGPDGGGSGLLLCIIATRGVHRGTTVGLKQRLKVQAKLYTCRCSRQCPYTLPCHTLSDTESL